MDLNAILIKPIETPYVWTKRSCHRPVQPARYHLSGRQLEKLLISEDKGYVLWITPRGCCDLEFQYLHTHHDFWIDSAEQFRMCFDEVGLRRFLDMRVQRLIMNSRRLSSIYEIPRFDLFRDRIHIDAEFPGVEIFECTKPTVMPRLLYNGSDDLNPLEGVSLGSGRYTQDQSFQLRSMNGRILLKLRAIPDRNADASGVNAFRLNFTMAL